MALLTPEQLAEIRKIIERRHAAVIVNTLGPDALGDEELLKDLQKRGLIDPKARTLEEAYLYGQALAQASDPKLASMSYEEFKRWVRKNPIPLNDNERQALRMAAIQGAQYVRGLGNRVDVATGQTLIEADAALRQRMRDEIKSATAANVERRQSLKTLKSDLGHATADWSRDFDRIAITEKHNAMHRGLADNIAKRYGGDSRVAKIPMPGACVHCKRLHLGPDGAPRIFQLSDLESNGSNVGRKTDMWLPVVGATHPHCQCQLVRVPPGWGFDEEGRLVPGGELGKSYRSEGDVWMALRAEDELRKALDVVGHTEFQGLSVAIENPVGSIRSWRTPEGGEGQTVMRHAYGYIEGAWGDDGDELDVFLGPDPRAENAYVIHQKSPRTGNYDEAKVMLGFPNEKAAVEAYLANYDNPDFLWVVSPMAMDHFKRWIRHTAPSDGPLAKAKPRTPKLVVPVTRAEKLAKGGGPFIGPRGGKWADAEHTIPWKEEAAPGSVSGVPEKHLRLLAEKFPTKESFLRAKLSGFGAKDAAQIASIIDQASTSKLDLAALQHALKGGEPYFKHKVSVSDVDAHTHGEVTPSGKEDLTKPIVVGSGGDVLDGRHRTMVARRRGLSELPAWLPADRFYDEAVKPFVGRPKLSEASLVGSKFTVPVHPKIAGGHYSPEYEVTAVTEDKVKLNGRVEMPKASLKHFINDLQGKVDLPPSKNPDVNAVVSGKAEFLGKGDDGLAFKAGDKVVKVSTTVPFQPDNPGHRSPVQAAKMLQDQVDVGNLLADKGIKGIQRSTFVSHGDKGFQIKPWVEIPEKFTKAQLDAIQDIVIEVHKAGYALRDQVQAGIDRDGNLVLFDVGKAAPQSKATGIYSDVTGDMQNLAHLYREHGQPFARRDIDEGAQAWEKAHGQLDKWLAKGSWGFASMQLEMASKLRQKVVKATLEGAAQEKALAEIKADLDEALLEIETAKKIAEKKEPLKKAQIPSHIGAQTSRAGHRAPGPGTMVNFVMKVPRPPVPKVNAEDLKSELVEMGAAGTAQGMKRTREDYDIDEPFDRTYPIDVPEDFKELSRPTPGEAEKNREWLEETETARRGPANRADPEPKKKAKPKREAAVLKAQLPYQEETLH